MHLVRFVLQATLAYGAVAFPSTSERRDLGTIQSAIGTVQSALEKLNTAVNGLTADPQTAAPILTASQNAQAALQKATQDISGSDELGLISALRLQQMANGLTSAVQTAMDSLVAKKPVLDQLGVTSVAVMSLQTQQSASAAFGDALVSKVPAIGRGLARQSINQVNEILDKGIQDLQRAGAGAEGGASTATSAITTSSASATTVVGSTTAATSVAPSFVSAPINENGSETETETETATATSTVDAPEEGVSSLPPAASGLEV
ncbi:hydrophobic surface binding protein A-domain-containing protein [Chaetomium strumarium]|uniref:Hydrophobic surface binding protein A-domain-containing protein n=1 Tax=Chaetomium strumarium TaxID=1170767 RepID=A0AAJ0M3H2_9PEZI|nr:hydrophobic surface binding protein A-domain-containing protein [Chaetomium strumarium]